MMRESWQRTKRKSYDSDNKWNRSLYTTSFPIIYSILIAAWIGVQEASASDCPPPNKIRGCPCYNFDDGLILECAKASEESLKITLANVMSVSKAKEAVVQSLSIYELDQKVEELRPIVFPNGIKMRNLQISHSSIREIDDNAFERLAPSLESLGLISGKLQQVPQKALAPLKRLNSLDLEGNHIPDLPSYSFFGLSLIKLNLKANEIGKISEYAFSGLEGTMKDLDLSENRIRIFPMTSLRRLEHLLSLKLASNEISHLPDDGFSRLDILNYLDLSYNNFEEIPVNCFRCCPVLKTLSLYYNSVELVDKDAFISLIHLESIDLSHNRILFLDKATFRANEKLRTIDLSHNHLHYIKGIFARLPELKELFLSENNIIEISSDTFTGSKNLLVLDLQHNAIRKLDSHGLSSLEKLAQLHLSDNFIDKLPSDFLNYCENLSTLSLDGNNIRDLEVGTFSKTKQLRELRLQDNQITEVRRGVFTPLPTLLELHLQNNAITDMETGALKSLHNLQHINLQGNLLAVLGDVFQLTNEPNNNGHSGSLVSIQLDNNGLGVLHNDSFRGQASVRIMWLGHNRLTRLQAPLFRDLLLVERLYLTNNSISRIEDNAFQPMQTLRFLELSMNRLTQVTGKTFSELRELEELHLQNNELRKIEPYAFTALKRLRVLNLSNNHLNILHSKIFQDGLPLRILNLKNCSISVIEDGAFKGLNNIYEMNLEWNLLETTTLESIDIPGLRIIRLSYNNFSEITGKSLNNLPSLQQIYMEGSYIRELPSNTFSKNKNLAKIMLSNNLLRTLPGTIFTGLESLREVKLDGNRFQEIPYDAFINSSTIEFLSISNNILLHINASRFNGLTNLRELDLSGNYIISLSGFAAANFSRLITINLSNNHLTALPDNFFIHSNELRKIDLAGNKFRQIPDVSLSGKNIPNLGWLNVTLNPLMRIREYSVDTKYPSIEEIHISNTNLTIVTTQDFEAFPALLHLFVSNNLISRVSPSAFRCLPHLLTLDLNSNELESLPQERLTGLEHLKLLNLTHNRLKALEDFPKDLKMLRRLDLSNNQITSISRSTFQQLVNLDELHLFGNRISSISADAFRSLKKLRVLDVSRNSLEIIPLNAFKPLETQMRSLRADENPLHCGCESQELWEWLRDHQKLIRSSVERNRGNGMGIDEDETGMLRCEQPAELRGLIFLDLDPHAFCSAPLVLKIAIQDIQPFSVVVSWQSRNHTGLHGYQVAYHAIDRADEVHGKILDPHSRSVKLSKLSSNMQYLICVIGLGNWQSDNDEKPSIVKFNSSNSDIFESDSIPEMIDTPTSLCTKVKTLETPSTIILTDGSAITDNSGVASVLTRRLGLIVGCCMGVVVFIILVSVLGYLKVKKQREAVKRDQQVIPPEYISYRHFSIQSGDASNNTRVNNNHDTNQTGFVNNVGQTTLNL